MCAYDMMRACMTLTACAARVEHNTLHTTLSEQPDDRAPENCSGSFYTRGPENVMVSQVLHGRGAPHKLRLLVHPGAFFAAMFTALDWIDHD